MQDRDMGNLMTEFHVASRDGDLDKVRDLLANPDVDVNQLGVRYYYNEHSAYY